MSCWGEGRKGVDGGRVEEVKEVEELRRMNC